LTWRQSQAGFASPAPLQAGSEAPFSRIGPMYPCMAHLEALRVHAATRRQTTRDRIRAGSR